VSNESQLQVRPKDGRSSLLEVRSGLIARGRRDAAILVVPCNKCGRCKDLVFAGCVCADCSDAFDRQWAASGATNWLVTKASDSSSVRDFVFLDTTYIQMKTHGWAANDRGSQYRGFFRYREGTPEEIDQLKSQWGTWSRFSGARVVRPATPEEGAAYERSNWEWWITGEMARIFGEECDKLGIREFDESPRVERAAEEIARSLRQLGWLESLLELKRNDSDALAQINGTRLFDMVLQKAAEGLQS
jgi:hypothetical protein